MPQQAATKVGVDLPERGFPMPASGGTGPASDPNGSPAVRDLAVHGGSLPPGGVTLVTQQGRFGPGLIRQAGRRGHDLHHLTASDDGIGLAVPDILAALAEEAITRVVAICLPRLQAIGPLLGPLEKLRASGSIVLVLPVDTLPQDVARRRDMLLAQSGAILVETAQELLDLAFYAASLHRVGLPRGNRAAIVTGGGGGGVIATDLCGHHGIQAPPLAPETRERLAALVPAIASTVNPIDLTPDMFTERWYDNFPAVLDAVASDPDIDIVFCPTTFNTPRGPVVAAQILADFFTRSPKPMMIGVQPATPMRPVFAAAGLVTVPDTAEAARCLMKLVRLATRPAPPPQGPVPDGAVQACDAMGKDADFASLTAMLAPLGWQAAPQREVAANVEALRAAARDIGYPVVVTALSAGRPSLGDLREADLPAALSRLTQQADTNTRLGVRQDRQGVASLCVTGSRHPLLGPLVTVDAGGAHAGLLDDLGLLRAPFDSAAALSLLSSRRMVGHAQRMNRGLTRDSTALALARFSALVAAAPWPSFCLTLDPVELLAAGPLVHDAHLTIGEPA